VVSNYIHVPERLALLSIEVLMWHLHWWCLRLLNMLIMNLRAH